MLGSSSVLFEAEDSVMLRQLELLENDGPVDGEDTELDTAESIARELSGLVSQAVKGGSAQAKTVRPSAELQRQGDGRVVATAAGQPFWKRQGAYTFRDLHGYQGTRARINGSC
ncbi:uncharacterized protein ACLA_006650 [Aspergillus clavatus NRRL 1]|uniref:Uncharacterized protein n=1 Tax=Aspergillus clavatus (strain ATCC 1007 / CBS 513.65 / DSM 816 / NCTC 3887 / NRRL 1 / QM 1276 / 107) TaxID=344612 RepID=A1CDI0_ASPCL|nr:uncharacterized protein ACLA_006650 [Aspergillus clavatus NRRL 1]EAW11907.1 hypothetical protein ACLA_006650 [Aspergillus clavatus NRRL 1]